MILLLLSVNNMKGARIGFAWLKQILERRRTQAIQLENVARREDDIDNHRRCSVR